MTITRRGLTVSNATMQTIIKPFRIPAGQRPDIDTADGVIPAVAVDGTHMAFWLVPQMQRDRRDSNGKSYPVRVGDGRVVYAVPGGGSYVQNVELTGAARHEREMKP